ncbi:MAG: hypothetical protein JOZ14_14525 [Acidobacteria bacterium]|nr:hypothetical protein [Acidobacteriota bacterium]
MRFDSKPDDRLPAGENLNLESLRLEEQLQVWLPANREITAAYRAHKNNQFPGAEGGN